jgi:hypothetical protein
MELDTADGASAAVRRRHILDLFRRCRARTVLHPGRRLLFDYSKTNIDADDAARC